MIFAIKSNTLLCTRFCSCITSHVLCQNCTRLAVMSTSFIAIICFLECIVIIGLRFIFFVEGYTYVLEVTYFSCKSQYCNCFGQLQVYIDFPNIINNLFKIFTSQYYFKSNFCYQSPYFVIVTFIRTLFMQKALKGDLKIIECIMYYRDFYLIKVN